MLSSSVEYIQALREGKYLLFLEWTTFITQKHTRDEEPLDADDTANFLVFEWLNNGYSDEDAKKLALLYAVYDLDSKPIQGKLDYSLKAISVALFLCMVFKKHDLSVTCDSKIKASEMNQLIKLAVTQLDPFVYRGCLEQMQAHFFQWVEHADKKEVDILFQKINIITKPRYLLEDYILHLERVKINQDALYDSRLSIAKRLLGYLYEQTEMTPEVFEKISSYINAIRAMHPNKLEESRLDVISPPSVFETTRRWLTGLGVGFFKMVLKEKSMDELISGKKETPNHNV